MASFTPWIRLLPILWLTACIHNNAADTIPQVEYQGQGQYNVPPPPTTLSGTLKAKTFQGGEILIEARRTVVCEFGRCPVLGAPPIGSETLKEPGPYTLELPESAKDLMVIATYQTPDGGLRIAHTSILSEATEITGVDLSLDRPYPPIR